MQPLNDQPVAKTYKFGDVTLDLLNFRLLKDGEPSRITPRAFEVLRYLVENSGRVVSKQEIFDNVWGDSFVTDNALTRMVREVRQALGDNAESPSYIETVPKRGYKFLMPVKTSEVYNGPEAINATYQRVSVEEEFIEVDDDDLRSEKNVGPRTEPIQAEQQRPALSGRAGSNRNRIILGIGGTLLILAAAILYYYARKPSVWPLITSENISLQRLTNTDNLYWAMLSPNGQFVAYVLLHPDGRQSLHLLDVASRSERMVVQPENVSFYGGGFKPDSSELYYDTYQHGVSSAPSTLYQIPVLGDTPRKVMEGVAGPVSFTPDGKRFVFSRLDPTATGVTQLVTANSADGSDHIVLAQSKYNVDFRAPNFSPDGKTILFVAGERREDGWYWQVNDMPASGGERRIVTGPAKQRIWGAAWVGRDGDILLNAQAPDTKANQLFIVARGTHEMRRLTNDLNSYTGLSATADGTKIVVTQDQRMNDIWMWPRNETQKPQKLTSRSVIIHSCTWAPSGRIVYNVLENGKDLLWSVVPETGNTTPLTSADVEGDFPDTSPDGRFIVYMSNRSGSWQVWRMNADGTNPKQITPDTEYPVRARFALGGTKIIVEREVQDRSILSLLDIDGGTPDDLSLPYVGSWSTTADGRTVAYDFYDERSGKYKTAVQSIEDRSRITYLDIIPKDFIALSPDGRSVVTKRHEPENDPMSTIWEFPVDGGQPRKLLTNPPDNTYWAEFSDDGNKLAMVQGRVISNLILFTRTEK